MIKYTMKKFKCFLLISEWLPKMLPLSYTRQYKNEKQLHLLYQNMYCIILARPAFINLSATQSQRAAIFPKK